MQTAVPLSGGTILKLLRNSFNMIDSRLIDHGVRAAWFGRQLLKHTNCSFKTQRDCCCLILLHDIGAYKTEEINQMVQFETESCWDHSLYGAVFLKHFSPFSDLAEAVLYHHSRYDKMKAAQLDPQLIEIAGLINFCDRLDIGTAFAHETPESFLTSVSQESDVRYSPALKALLPTLHLEAYRPEQGLAFLTDLEAKAPFTPEEIEVLLKMLVYIIDFRSRHTVTHTLVTASTAVQLGQLCGCTEPELMQLQTAAYLHDLGKIGISLEILENPGRLTHDEMEIMKTHVELTETILDSLVDPEIRDIAVRHHEKLNGTGYPHQLTASHLTLPQRILAIADIFSALTGRRSYKEAYTLERTCRILSELCAAGELDSAVTDAVLQHALIIASRNDSESKPILNSYLQIMREIGVLSLSAETGAEAEAELAQAWQELFVDCTPVVIHN